MTNTLFHNKMRLQLLDRRRIPKHIAIIPDGNRRWAKAHNLFSEKGHKAGINLVVDMVKAAKELDIKIVTFYFFSTENWNRSKKEVAYLKHLFKKFLTEKRPEMLDQGIRLRTIGELQLLSEDLQALVRKTAEDTEKCDQIEMVLALNYGSRNEIQRALIAMIDDYESKKLKKSDINEALISSYLDTAEWQEPDLLIRAGGEQRISNFLLWQLAYTEIYFSEKLWPDFTPDDLVEAMIDFQSRERRWGRR